MIAIDDDREASETTTCWCCGIATPCRRCELAGKCPDCDWCAEHCRCFRPRRPWWRRDSHGTAQHPRGLQVGRNSRRSPGV